jgi:hypothetical protein
MGEESLFRILTGAIEWVALPRAMGVMNLLPAPK